MNPKYYCRHCGGDNLDYKGIEDGAGDYGTALADMFECLDCGNYMEFNHVELHDDEDYAEADFTAEYGEYASDKHKQGGNAGKYDNDHTPPPRDMDDIPF
ncbi:MAG: hypothetical protein ACPG7F_21730 [Aggregatilineales bacterium]